MNERKHEAGPLRGPSEEWDIVHLYEEHRGVLLRLLMRKYGVPEEDAETLVYETIVALPLRIVVADAPAWLTAGVCGKGEAYRRARGLDPAADDAGDARDLALATLTDQAREALRLRFEEKRTYAEIAEELGVSVFAAERIVATAGAKLRQRMRTIAADRDR